MARYHWSLRQVGVVILVLLLVGVLFPIFPADSIILFFAFAIGLIAYGIRDARTKGLEPFTRLPKEAPVSGQAPTLDEVRRQEEQNRKAEQRSIIGSRIIYVVAAVILLIGIGAVAESTYQTSVNPYTYEVSPLSGQVLTIGFFGAIILFIVGSRIRSTAKIGISTMCPQCKQWRARLLVGKEELGSSEDWETVYDTVQTTMQIRNPDGSYSDATSTTSQPRTARVRNTNYLDEFACRFCGFKWKEPSTGRFVR